MQVFIGNLPLIFFIAAFGVKLTLKFKSNTDANACFWRPPTQFTLKAIAIVLEDWLLPILPLGTYLTCTQPRADNPSHLTVKENGKKPRENTLRGTQIISTDFRSCCCTAI